MYSVYCTIHLFGISTGVQVVQKEVMFKQPKVHWSGTVTKWSEGSAIYNARVQTFSLNANWRRIEKVCTSFLIACYMLQFSDGMCMEIPRKFQANSIHIPVKFCRILAQIWSEFWWNLRGIYDLWNWNFNPNSTRVRCNNLLFCKLLFAEVL